jgi:hypothetical protein
MGLLSRVYGNEMEMVHLPYDISPPISSLDYNYKAPSIAS